jgi:hypothetical protein
MHRSGSRGCSCRSYLLAAILILVISIVFGSAGAPRAESLGEKLTQDPVGFSNFLGQTVEEVVSALQLAPGGVRAAMRVAEEYNDKEVRFLYFDGKNGLHDYVQNWKFINGKFCVSGNSALFLFFNHGYAFKVEFRFLSTKTYGGYPPCEDHIALFNLLARQIGGFVEKRSDGTSILTRVDGDVIEYLEKPMNGSMSWLWFLRGGPEKLW